MSGLYGMICFLPTKEAAQVNDGVVPAIVATARTYRLTAEALNLTICVDAATFVTCANAAPVTSAQSVEPSDES
jgi:hypothetical protein